MKMFLVGLAVVACLLALEGCGGKTTEQSTVFVEAGATARVATDKPQPVTVKDVAGKDHIEKRNIGGMIVMPKTNYDELRRGYLANSIKPDPNAVAPSPPVSTKLSPVDVLPPK